MRLGAIAVLMAAIIAACAAPDEPSPSPAAPSTSRPSATPDATSTPVPTPTTTPEPSPTPPTAGIYLALGDSLAVGVGATRPEETGYVARLHRLLSEEARVTDLRNLAVSGETSTSMIRTGQLAAAIETIETADPPISVVTLDIGGNDLLRLLGTDACAQSPQSQECLQLLALTLQDFETNYRQIVRELAAVLDANAPDARLAAMTYFNPFSGTDASYERAGELALLGVDGQVECETDDPQARGMNDIIACVAEEMGGLAVDVQPSFAGLGLELTHIAREDIHANDRGYEVIADLFAQALSDADGADGASAWLVRMVRA